MDTEGQLSWIRELVPPESAKTDEELRSYCVGLLNGNERANAPRGECRTEWSTITAEKLNVAALSVLTGDKKNAELMLNELDELLNGMRGVTEAQREVILYCRDLLRWQNEGCVDSNEGKRLDRKWGVLDDFGGKEVDALISYLKGSLGYKLRVRDCIVRNFYLEAWDLDPKCLAWYHHSYRMVREIRRAKEGIEQVPDQMEKYLAQKAYQLCDGKNKVAAADYGLMLKDTFKKEKREFWRDLHSAFVKVLENALPSAQGESLMKLRLHLAEFLYFGEGPPEDRTRGREMFSELERDYPESFAVLHKAGNLYRMERKFDQARECYKRALELEPTVVPCIMDYLKLLKCNKDQAEIVRVLKKALSPEFVTSEKDHAKLQRELDLAMRRSSATYFTDHWKLEYVNN